MIKPTIKNFKGDKKEPTPTPTAAINQNQPPIIVIPPQPQTPPTNYFQPPQISPVLSIENTRELTSESPKNNLIKKKPKEPQKLEVQPIDKKFEASSPEPNLLSARTPEEQPKPINEPKQNGKNSEINEKNPEPTAIKKNGKKRKKSKNHHNYKNNEK